MKILSKQNFNQNESKNFVVDNLSSAPSNPILGQVYYNTQDERAYVCIKSGETPEWADLSLQEEVSIGGEEPNGRDVKIWINPEDITSSSDYGSLPIGSIIPYSGETAPEGYSICDGKELNRETYKELFSIIGTTFGNGDGTSTFNLPDLKGRVSVGLDSSDTNFNTIGKTGGEKTHTLTIDEIPAHTHNLTYNISGAGANTGGTVALGNTSTTSSFATLPTGGSKEHNNLQPYIVLNYIIKIYGEAMLTGDVIDSLEGDSSYNAPSIHAVNDKIKKFEAYSSTAINEGSYVTLSPNPNPNYNPINIQIDGKSEQTTYTGKNLFSSKLEVGSIDTTTGLNATNNTRKRTKDFISIQPNTTYTFSYKNQGNYAKWGWYILYDNNQQIVSSYTFENDYDVTFTSSNDAYYFKMYFGNAANVDVNSFDCQLEKGTVATEYEPYVGGQPSPSPDYPQEIKSVSGVENLLNVSNTDKTINGVTFTKNSDGTITVNGTATATTIYNLLENSSLTLEKGTYILSGCPNGGSNSTYKLDIPVGSYPTDYGASAKVIVNEETTYNSMRIVIYSGTTLNDLVFKPMLSKTFHDYVPYGHWLRVKNTGKNLFTLGEEVYPISNVSMSLNDSEIKMDGTVSAAGNLLKRRDDFPIAGRRLIGIFRPGNYTYSCSIKKGSITLPEKKEIELVLKKQDDTFIKAVRYSSDKLTTTHSFTLTETTKLYSQLYANGVGTIFDNVIMNFQIEKGTVATEYEPYQEQSTLIDMNKPNLFDKDNESMLLDNVAINAGTAQIYNAAGFDCIKIPCKPNTTYTISKIVSNRFVVGYSNNETYTSGEKLVYTNANNTASYLTITTGDNAKSLYVMYTKLADETTLTKQEILDSIKIYEGVGTDDYYELSSIGDTKDKLNIDKEGNVSIKQNIGEVVLDGSDDESWDTSGAGVDEGVKAYRTSFNISNLKTDTDIISNRFVNNRVNWFTDLSAGKMINTANNLYIRINETIAPDVETLKTWLSTHPVIVKYILAEPQTISLGKITPLKLLEGTNNITTNDELQPNMKIEYYTDVMGNPGIIPDYDGLPVGSEFDFDGTEIPDGFIQIDDPNTYSSEEVVIGTWFGKTLYRKVIVKTITKSGDNIFSLSSVGLENIDKYITLKSISNGNPINEDYYTTNADLLRTLINYDGLHIQLGTSYPSVPCLIYTIVEYTKTTD